MGWRPVLAEVQFPNTMTTDLAAGEDELLAGMKSKTRYNIRLAHRRGVRVRRGSRGDLDAFFRLYKATAARGGFAIRTQHYYQDAWSTLLASGPPVVNSGSNTPSASGPARA